MSEGRTGSLVAALAEGVRSDLAEIAADLDAVRLKVETLGESARAVNGLGGECAGWSNHLASLIAEVKKEQTEVPAKLLGTPINPITTSVDTEHAMKVSQARRAS